MKREDGPGRQRMSSLYFRVFNILIVRLYRKDNVPAGSTRILETKILVVLEMPERNEEPGFKSDYCFLWK